MLAGPAGSWHFVGRPVRRAARPSAARRAVVTSWPRGGPSSRFTSVTFAAFRLHRDARPQPSKEGFGPARLPARRRTSASPSAERPGRLRGGAGGGKCGGGGHGNGSHRVAWGAAAWSRGAHGGKRVMRAGGRCHMPGSRKCRATGTGTTSRQEENFWARVLRKRPLAALRDPARAGVLRKRGAAAQAAPVGFCIFCCTWRRR